MRGRLVAAVTLGLSGPAAAQPAPASAPPRLERLGEVGPWFARCWRPPFAESIGETNEVTVRFSLRRDGTVIGEPLVTHTTRELPDPLRAAYRTAAIAMLARCAPAPVSDSLGAAIAGRPFTLRLRHGGDGRHLRRL
jgi:hypothetical protein